MHDARSIRLSLLKSPRDLTLDELTFLIHEATEDEALEILMLAKGKNDSLLERAKQLRAARLALK